MARARPFGRFVHFRLRNYLRSPSANGRKCSRLAKSGARSKVHVRSAFFALRAAFLGSLGRRLMRRRSLPLEGLDQLTFDSIRFYSILFESIRFYSILLVSIRVHSSHVEWRAKTATRSLLLARAPLPSPIPLTRPEAAACITIGATCWLARSCEAARPPEVALVGPSGSNWLAVGRARLEWRVQAPSRLLRQRTHTHTHSAMQCNSVGAPRSRTHFRPDGRRSKRLQTWPQPHRQTDRRTVKRTDRRRFKAAPSPICGQLDPRA